jgi:hypothetical protein
MQVNLLLFCTQVLKLMIFFTLTCKYNSVLHIGVEAGDEAHPGPRVLSDQGAAPSWGGGSIGRLRIRRPGTGSTAIGCPMSSELC